VIIKKACPFCGAEALVEYANVKGIEERILYSIGCGTKECFGHLLNCGYRFKSEVEAISSWNERFFFKGKINRTRISVKEIIKELRYETVPSLAAKYGVTEQAVYARIKRYGFDAREISASRRVDIENIRGKI